VTVGGSTSACDAGKQQNQKTVGPTIRILGISVGDGRPMPADGAIQIAFDRYLLPFSVNRQAVFILDGARQPLPSDLLPIVQYDPVARTVTLRAPKQPWLTEGQPYHLVFPVAEGDGGGIRAIDRAPLFSGQPLDYAFTVGPPSGLVLEPQVTFCRDVLPIFSAKCSIPTCHGSGDRAAAGLVLDTTVGVLNTAVGRLSQAANTGASTTPKDPGPVFGVDMPLIQPGNPGNSWLLYKVELAPQPTFSGAVPRFACTAGQRERPAVFSYTPLAPQAQRAADDIERSILSDLILGREMPFPVSGTPTYSDSPLTFDERQKIRIWIQTLDPAVALPECGGCGVIEEFDGGAILVDGGGVDAGADSGDAGITDAATDAPDGD